MSARFLIWALGAFLVFGAVAFLALIAVVVDHFRSKRRERVREAFDPVRPLRRE